MCSIPKRQASSCALGKGQTPEWKTRGLDLAPLCPGGWQDPGLDSLGLIFSPRGS